MNKIAIIFGIFFFCAGTLFAQNESPQINYSQDKGSALEIGVHAGHLFAAGNIDFKPGFGVGIHLRQSLDYVFSLRGNLLYGKISGEDSGNIRSFETTYFSGSIQALVTLNNLKWNLGERKINLYALMGIGANNFEAELVDNDISIPKIDAEVAGQVEFGAGLSFRINDKFNVGIEHQITSIIGKRSDLVDGVSTLPAVKDDRSTFNDLIHYTSVRLNFNLKGKEAKTEPLYWLNPMEAIVNDVQLLKDTRVVMTDEDEDGVIDMLDEEEETPEGAPVDAKGVALDSDKDGVSDFNDKEPYSPVGYETNDEGVAQVPDIMAEVNRLVEERLKDFQPATAPSIESTGGLNNWYLPSIYFAQNSSSISDDAFGTLYNIARALKANPNTKIVVTGHADNSGSTDYNNKLSFERATLVIKYLVEEMGVSRSALILQYKGEAANILDKIHEVNRRVDFKVANEESEMSAPK